MTEPLNERWSHFLEGGLPATEQQALLQDISRGERLTHDPLLDVEMHGLLGVLAQVAQESEDEFATKVMQQVVQAGASPSSPPAQAPAIPSHDSDASLSFNALEHVQRPEPVKPSPSLTARAEPSAFVSSATRGIEADGRGESQFLRRWPALAVAVAAVAVIAVVLVNTLPNRNAAQNPELKQGEPPRPSLPEGSLLGGQDKGAPPSNSENSVPETPLPPETSIPATEIKRLPPNSVQLPPSQGLAYDDRPQDATPVDPSNRHPAYPQPQPVWSVKALQSQLTKWGSPLPKDIQGTTLRLLEGSVDLAFGEVGELTIHAPAEFRPEESQLFLKHGRIMARTMAPMTVQTPSSGIEIISRASIVADPDGTSVTAIGPVGIQPIEDTAPMIVPPGQFRWVSKTGHVCDWMIAMLETEGVMTLVVNGELFGLNPITAANPARMIQSTIAQQMRTRPDPKDFRGVLLINGKSYSYDGTRGLMSAGKRLTDQLKQRQRAAAAAGLRLNINGVEVSGGIQARIGAEGIVVPSAANSAIARKAADELLMRQQQLIQSMQQGFGVDLSGAQKAVDQARQRIHQVIPDK